MMGLRLGTGFLSSNTGITVNSLMTSYLTKKPYKIFTNLQLAVYKHTCFTAPLQTLEIIFISLLMCV